MTFKRSIILREEAQTHPHTQVGFSDPMTSPITFIKFWIQLWPPKKSHVPIYVGRGNFGTHAFEYRVYAALMCCSFGIFIDLEISQCSQEVLKMKCVKSTLFFPFSFSFFFLFLMIILISRKIDELRYVFLCSRSNGNTMKNSQIQLSNIAYIFVEISRK